MANNSAYEFVVFKYEKKKLVDRENNIYQSDGKSKKGPTFYRCVQRTKGCGGREVLSESGTFIVTKEHHHEGKIWQVQIETKNTHVVEMVRSDLTTMPHQ